MCITVADRSKSYHELPSGVDVFQLRKKSFLTFSRDSAVSHNPSGSTNQTKTHSRHDYILCHACLQCIVPISCNTDSTSDVSTTILSQHPYIFVCSGTKLQRQGRKRCFTMPWIYVLRLIWQLNHENDCNRYSTTTPLHIRAYNKQPRRE